MSSDKSGWCGFIRGMNNANLEVALGRQTLREATAQNSVTNSNFQTAVGSGQSQTQTTASGSGSGGNGIAGDAQKK